MLQKLDELYIDSSVTFFVEHHPESVVFEKKKKLKKVYIEDAKILQYMPEIEDLVCKTNSEESTRELKKYLESHTQLKKLKVWLRSADNFPFVALGDIHFELKSFTLLVRRNSYLSNHAINFIKSQAKTLKFLKLDDFTYNLDIIQDIFDGMEELETVSIYDGRVEPQTTDFVEKSFEYPKLKKLRLRVEDLEYPGLFRKFPNLKTLYLNKLDSTAMVDSAVQNCRNVTNLTIWNFNEVYQNATFPKVTKLTICTIIEGSESSFEDFLTRHQKLKIFEWVLNVKKEILWKLPALLPNLSRFEFESFEGFTEEDLTKLLAPWESIKKLNINSYMRFNQRELDLEAATKDIHRKIMICHITERKENVLNKSSVSTYFRLLVLSIMEFFKEHISCKL
jgi:hypothetical protein